MRRLSFSVVVLAASIVSSAFAADPRDFTLVNSTGYPLAFIGVNSPGDENFNENELNGVLVDGANTRIRFSKADVGCTWNLRVRWTDNSSSTFRGLNLCQIETVTLKYDRASNTASYTTE